MMGIEHIYITKHIKYQHYFWLYNTESHAVCFQGTFKKYLYSVYMSTSGLMKVVQERSLIQNSRWIFYLVKTEIKPNQQNKTVGDLKLSD